jgi:hypothetical protein
MATPDRQNGGAIALVRLTDIPRELRLSVAHELATRWRLRGIDYALFLLSAESPVENPLLWVPAEKAALALAGKRPGGSLPDELKIPPVLNG